MYDKVDLEKINHLIIISFDDLSADVFDKNVEDSRFPSLKKIKFSLDDSEAKMRNSPCGEPTIENNNI